MFDSLFGILFGFSMTLKVRSKLAIKPSILSRCHLFLPPDLGHKEFPERWVKADKKCPDITLVQK